MGRYSANTSITPTFGIPRTLKENSRISGNTTTATGCTNRSMAVRRPLLFAVKPKRNQQTCAAIPGAHTAEGFFRHPWPHEFGIRHTHDGKSQRIQSDRAYRSGSQILETIDPLFFIKMKYSVPTMCKLVTLSPA